MKICLSLMLSALLLSLPLGAQAAGFDRAAAKTSQDLRLAQKENQATQKEMAATLTSLGRRLVELETRLESERQGLARDQEELGRLSRERAELSQEITEKSGDLKELSGHVRASARDLLALAESSPVTAEHPGRLEILRGYLDPGYFPGLKEIKSLVELYLEEMSLNGLVLKRTGALVNRAGREARGQIVRLGGFTTLYQAGEESGFLSLGQASGSLLAVSGEPPWDLAGPLKDFIAGSSAGRAGGYQRRGRPAPAVAPGEPVGTFTERRAPYIPHPGGGPVGAPFGPGAFLVFAKGSGQHRPDDEPG